jgi:hypothetical protein
MLTELKLDVYSLKSELDIKTYNEFLTYFPNNPFYLNELLTSSSSLDLTLKYFILNNNDGPYVLMPFYLRNIKIDNQDSGYFDVSSTYGYSGPLFNNDVSVNILSQFWKKVDSWYKKNNVVSELIRFNMIQNWIGYSGELISTLKNVKGKLRSNEVLWENFKPKVRNNYRKGLKAGINVVIYDNDITKHVIKQFYDLYINTMLRKEASEFYKYSLDYFINFISINANHCAVALTYKDDVPISTELLLYSKENLYSFLGGTDANYFNLRPNDTLKVEVMKWANEKQLKYYVLGGGKVNNDTLYKYKKDFFPNDLDVIFYTGRKIINKKLYDLFSSLNPSCNDCINNDYFPEYRCSHNF